MTKWEVVLNTETRIIEADNWGVSRSGDFCAFYNQPGTKKTRNPFHYIKTADIHEIRRLDEQPQSLSETSIEAFIANHEHISMEEADTIIQTPPRQPPVASRE